jgi:hypothetical protein
MRNRPIEKPPYVVFKKEIIHKKHKNCKFLTQLPNILNLLDFFKSVINNRHICFFRAVVADSPDELRAILTQMNSLLERLEGVEDVIADRQRELLDRYDKVEALQAEARKEIDKLRADIEIQARRVSVFSDVFKFASNIRNAYAHGHVPEAPADTVRLDAADQSEKLNSPSIKPDSAYLPARSPRLRGEYRGMTLIGAAQAVLEKYLKPMPIAQICYEVCAEDSSADEITSLQRSMSSELLRGAKLGRFQRFGRGVFLAKDVHIPKSSSGRPLPFIENFDPTGGTREGE